MEQAGIGRHYELEQSAWDRSPLADQVQGMEQRSSSGRGREGSWGAPHSEESFTASENGWTFGCVREACADRRTEINFRRLRSVAEALGDEDFEFLEEVAAKGVPLGVDEEMPRTPAVYEEKEKWTVEQTEEEFHDTLGARRSAKRAGH